MENWQERDERAVWHPYTPTPIEGPRALFSSAQGAFVFDHAGKRYLDATSSWWCCLHGHCHPKLVEALRRQAGCLDQIMFAPHTHELAISLAERLVSALGAPFERVFFSDNGSTAVETALKISLQYWANQGKARTGFISLEQGYHGDTLGAVAVSHLDAFHRHFTGVAEKISIPIPTDNDALARAERQIELVAGQAAAIIVEPLLLGAAGMRMYPARCLDALVRMARRYGLLVIFDEVFTGFGRTGTMFAMEQLVERPDIVCLSKGLTSGMLPLAATVTTAGVFDAFRGGAQKTFYHGHTYTANPLGCAVALASLDLFTDDNVLERNRSLARVIAAEGERFCGLPHVSGVRQLGMVWAMDLHPDAAASRLPIPLNGPGWKIAGRLWEQGVWLRPLHNTLYVVPPYCVTEANLRHLFEVLYSAVCDEEHFR